MQNRRVFPYAIGLIVLSVSCNNKPPGSELSSNTGSGASQTWACGNAEPKPGHLFSDGVFLFSPTGKGAAKFQGNETFQVRVESEEAAERLVALTEPTDQIRNGGIFCLQEDWSQVQEGAISFKGSAADMTLETVVCGLVEPLNDGNSLLDMPVKFVSTTTEEGGTNEYPLSIEEPALSDFQKVLKQIKGTPGELCIQANWVDYEPEGNTQVTARHAGTISVKGARAL